LLQGAGFDRSQVGRPQQGDAEQRDERGKDDSDAPVDDGDPHRQPPTGAAPPFVLA